MMRIYNENDRLLEIKEDGEVLYDDEKRIDRSKISETSRNDYKAAIENGDWKKAHSILFHILTGEKL